MLACDVDRGKRRVADDSDEQSCDLWILRAHERKFAKRPESHIALPRVGWNGGIRPPVDHCLESAWGAIIKTVGDDMASAISTEKRCSPQDGDDGGLHKFATCRSATGANR